MPGTAIRPWLRGRARELRRVPTEAEGRLWRVLRRVNRQGQAHFRRQAPIGAFIVDFADLGRRLAIEIDGRRHGGEAGAARDRHPGAAGGRRASPPPRGEGMGVGQAGTVLRQERGG